VANVDFITAKTTESSIFNSRAAILMGIRASTLKRILPKSAAFLQLIADIGVIWGSMLIGYWFYHLILSEFNIGKGPQPFDQYIRLSIFTTIILLVTFERMGLYRRTMSIMNIEEVKGLFKAVIYTGLILFTASFYFKDISYSRLIVTYSLGFLLVFLNIERYIIYKLFQYLHIKGIGVSRVLVYGAGEAGKMLVERFVRSPRLGTLVLGFIDDNPELWGRMVGSRSVEVRYNLPVVGGFDHIREAVEQYGAEELFISLPSVSQIRMAEIIRECEQIGVKFNFMPNLFDYKMQHIAVRSLDGIPLLTVKETHLTWWKLAAKRGMDVIMALGNLILWGPLMIAITYIVKKSSPGPVLFKQERVGLNGRKFIMYKFRSMYVDTPKYALTPENSHDPRITPIGRFLRKTSLDELPQFFNVLKGDMSIVGPRPEMSFIVDQYDQIQRDRLKLKPGITGLWQISADRAKQIHDNIEYDLYYVENVSPLLDLVIILRTVIEVFRGKGAS
jgi:exopolysaccharide biosynthesis polyprenyl glycosylphosphotransferase